MRYADDVLLFTKSLPELCCMTEIFTTELGLFGLELNYSNTEILDTEFQNEEGMSDFVEIDEFMGNLDHTAPGLVELFVGLSGLGDGLGGRGPGEGPALASEGSP